MGRARRADPQAPRHGFRLTVVLTHLELRAAEAETLEVPERSFDAVTVRWGFK